jgi:hypothetical protein
VQVQRAGVALVNAERLEAVVRAMDDDAITLETDEHLNLIVRGAQARFTLLAMVTQRDGKTQSVRPQDFPPFPEADAARSFSMKAVDLRRMVNQTVFAAAKESGQYAKAAVLFRTTPGLLERVATDGREAGRGRRGMSGQVPGVGPPAGTNNCGDFGPMVPVKGDAMAEKNSSSSDSKDAAPAKGRVYGMHGSEAAGKARARLPMTVSLTPEMRELVEDARERAGGITNVELVVRLLRFFVRHEALWPIILGWPGRFAAPLQPLLDQLAALDGLDTTGDATREGEERKPDTRTT